jgi:hypothetical protein
MELHTLALREPEPFAPIPGLDSRDVHESLARLASHGLIDGGEHPTNVSTSWSKLRVTALAGSSSVSGRTWIASRVRPRFIGYCARSPTTLQRTSAARSFERQESYHGQRTRSSAVPSPMFPLPPEGRRSRDDRLGAERAPSSARAVERRRRAPRSLHLSNHYETPPLGLDLSAGDVHDAVLALLDVGYVEVRNLQYESGPEPYSPVFESQVADSRRLASGRSSTRSVLRRLWPCCSSVWRRRRLQRRRRRTFSGRRDTRAARRLRRCGLWRSGRAHNSLGSFSDSPERSQSLHSGSNLRDTLSQPDA